MDELVYKSLSQEVQSSFHRTMLQDCIGLVDMSRRRMEQYYAKWDAADAIYRGKMQVDEEDRRANERGEPAKFVVPITYSQVQTFISFCMGTFLQRDRFFELVPVNQQSHKAAIVGEALLQRDLLNSKLETLLYQFLLDIARFGIGILKSTWVRETESVREPLTMPRGSFMGVELGGAQYGEVEREAVRFLGNRIFNISPYRFFPDTRLPLSRFQEGEFVASEDVFTMTQLKAMERNGIVAGISHVKPLKGDGETVFRRLGFDENTPPFRGTGQSLGRVVVTEVQRTLIPSEYEIDGKPLGKEDYPVKYVIWYVNDNRVIKCEPLKMGHSQYTYDVAEYNPDMHHLVNESLSDNIEMLQKVITWFINSRITSVRKVISNRLVVDPDGVEWKDLEERSPVIRMKPTVMGRGVDRYIKQLDVHDVTTNHLADARYLKDLVQITTGINENLQGQFYPGRRSAREAGNVAMSAMNRLRMVARIIFVSALEPLGRKMLANLRNGLDEATVVRVVGRLPATEGASFLTVTKDDLQGDCDFEIFDGTLPTEKVYTSQTLQEILAALLASPQAAIALGLDPKEMLLEMLRTRGVRNPERFLLKGIPQNGSRGETTPTATAFGPTGTPGSVPPSEGQEPLLQALAGGGQQ